MQVVVYWRFVFMQEFKKKHRRIHQTNNTCPPEVCTIKLETNNSQNYIQDNMPKIVKLAV
jgi:hypothetical protein